MTKFVVIFRQFKKRLDMTRRLLFTLMPFGFWMKSSYMIGPAPPISSSPSPPPSPSPSQSPPVQKKSLDVVFSQGIYDRVNEINEISKEIENQQKALYPVDDFDRFNERKKRLVESIAKRSKLRKQNRRARAYERRLARGRMKCLERRKREDEEIQKEKEKRKEEEAELKRVREQIEIENEKKRKEEEEARERMEREREAKRKEEEEELLEKMASEEQLRKALEETIRQRQVLEMKVREEEQKRVLDEIEHEKKRKYEEAQLEETIRQRHVLQRKVREEEQKRVRDEIEREKKRKYEEAQEKRKKKRKTKPVPVKKKPLRNASRRVETAMDWLKMGDLINFDSVRLLLAQLESEPPKSVPRTRCCLVCHNDVVRQHEYDFYIHAVCLRGLVQDNDVVPITDMSEVVTRLNAYRFSTCKKCLVSGASMVCSACGCSMYYHFICAVADGQAFPYELSSKNFEVRHVSCCIGASGYAVYTDKQFHLIASTSTN